MFQILEINTYINGLTHEELQYIEDMIMTVDKHDFDGYVSNLNKSTNIVDMQLMHNLKLICAAIMYHKLDVLEYVIYNYATNSMILKSAFEFACYYDVVIAAEYLDMFGRFCHDHMLYVILEYKNKNDSIIAYLIQNTNLSPRAVQKVVCNASFSIAKSFITKEKKYDIKLCDTTWSGNLNLVKLYEEAGYDISRKDVSDAIFPCARGGFVHIAKYLIKKYNLDTKSKIKAYARTAATNGQIKFLKYLTNLGFDLVTNNNSILKSAISTTTNVIIHRHGVVTPQKNCCVKIIKFLIANGLSLDSNNKYILTWAYSCGNLPAVKYFLGKGQTIEQVFAAMRSFKGIVFIHNDTYVNSIQKCTILLRKSLISMLKVGNTNLTKQIMQFAKKENYNDLIDQLNSMGGHKILEV
jgi:hypothetical protein